MTGDLPSASTGVADSHDAPDANGIEPPATPEGRGRAHRRPRQRGTRIALEWLSIALVAVLLALGLRTFVFQAYYIPSGSMLPTLGIGDRILTLKLFFSPSKLHTGDIIVFSRPPAASCAVGEKDLVKRVIGTPGETITSVGNTIYIDGKAISEPYLAPGTSFGPAITNRTIYGQTLPSVIPPNEFFVMGDNRADSCDSRYWGYVSGSEVVGKVVLDWWHNSHPNFHIF